MPRHGGEDPGASGNGIVEKDLTLKISKYMYDRFRQLGIPVAITRDSDITLSPTDRTNKILNQFGNTKDVIVISNHINAGGGDGAEVIYALRNNNSLANLVLNNLESTGQNGRKVYQRRLPSDTSKDYYFIHRNTGVTEPIIVEYGFLDSTLDDVSQLKNNWQNLAEAVVKGVSEYTNTPYDKGGSSLYTVKSGDTLWSIAKKYNITVDELKRLNNLTSNVLSIGQNLIVNDQPISTPSEGEYVIKSGDTLYSIAKRFNVTVDDIKSVNNLNNNILTVGNTLVIPNNINDNNEIVYTVKKGDTLYQIARNYNLNPNDIIRYNNLTSNILSIGQVLRIPDQEIKEEEQVVQYIEYVVKKGDSLYSIARANNISVSDIMSFNNLNSSLLSIGQVIKIPVSKEQDTFYTVKKGDTLYQIASRFNTTVDSIKNKNNLTSNILTIGQVLTI